MSSRSATGAKKRVYRPHILYLLPTLTTKTYSSNIHVLRLLPPQHSIPKSNMDAMMFSASSYLLLKTSSNANYVPALPPTRPYFPSTNNPTPLSPSSTSTKLIFAPSAFHSVAGGLQSNRSNASVLHGPTSLSRGGGVTTSSSTAGTPVSILKLCVRLNLYRGSVFLMIAAKPLA